MVAPLHSPILPGNLTQQVHAYQGHDLRMSFPVQDANGVTYNIEEIGEMWFGMIGRDNEYGPQKLLEQGIELQMIDTVLYANLTINGSELRALTPGEYRFLFSASIGGSIIPQAGGLVQLHRSPVKFAF